MKDENELNNVQKNSKLSASLLDAFSLLREAVDDVKLKGGMRIILQLEGNESEKEVQYVLKRLVRSLGANVPDARFGYFATLVALLTKHIEIPISQLFELAKKELHASGASKSEVGDVALGQILVCGAIFRSGLMLRSSEVDQKQVIELLMTASKKKSYLSTVAYLILLDYTTVLSEDQFCSMIWNHMKQDFKKEISEHTLDSLYFLLVVSNKFPGKVKLRKLIGVAELLCEDNIHVICEKLMAGIDFNSISHPIYTEIGKQIANSPCLQLFWTSGIDSHLVKHNRNRELVSISILTAILSNLNENVQVIPELLSKNFFKLFMDWFKGLQTASKIRNKRDNEDDHKLMIKKEKELLNALSKALQLPNVDCETRIETLKKLLFYPGEMNFTEVSGTSIVKSIMSDLDKAAVKKMAKLFKGVLLNTSKKVMKEDVERSWYNNERVKAAELLSYLVSHEAMKEDTDFKLTYMKILMCFGFFKLGGDNNVLVSSELSGSIKTCFYRCFTSRFSNVDNLVSVLSSLCNFICGIMKKEEVRAKMEKQFPAENMECWEMLTKICQSIETNHNKSKVDKVFLILQYQLGLFLFSEPTHVKIARSSIKELKSCYEHYRKSKKSKSNGNDLSEEPEWIEVLVEVLMSILSIDSSVLRSVVQCVFRLLWEDLTASCVAQIVSVLDPDSETNPLTNDDESDVENDDQDSENESSNDAENVNEEDDSDSEVEEEDDEEMKTPEQLRLAVQKALGNVAQDSDPESVDADMIDEEEGKKLDEALAEAFKQFHQGKVKKGKKDRKDKKALSDFRVRVLDLLDIYLEKDPSMDICLSMISPLTRSLESCIADNQFRDLENRLRKTIKNLTKIRKFSSSDDVTVEILCEYLKNIIDKGSRSHFMFQAIGDIVTSFATFIISCALKIENKSSTSLKKKKEMALSPLTELFKDTVRNYFLNRNCILPIIFYHNVLQTEWEGRYELMPIIIKNVFNNNVRQFRRNEGIDLMAGFYRALKRNKPTSGELLIKLSNIEKEFENKLISALSGETELEVKNNFFVALKKLINTMKIFHESCNVKSSIDFNRMLNNVSISKAKLVVKTNKNNNIKLAENGEQQKIKSNKKFEKMKRKVMTKGHEPEQKKARIDSRQSE